MSSENKSEGEIYSVKDLGLAWVILNVLYQEKESKNTRINPGFLESKIKKAKENLLEVSRYLKENEMFWKEDEDYILELIGKYEGDKALEDFKEKLYQEKYSEENTSFEDPLDNL